MSREDYKGCIERELSARMALKKGKKVNFKYKKNSLEMYELLQEYGDEAQAIKWAKQLDDNFQDTNFASHNPCTKVYQLIEKLNDIRKS